MLRNVAGIGGRGVFLSDNDMNGIPDYRSADSDSDGALDIHEGNDFNGNGTGVDDLTALTYLDTDGDGLDNRFDSLNSVTDIRGTSSKMGLNGAAIGDPAPGTRSPVQKTFGTQTDRDWRYVGYVLDVQLLNFKGNVLNDFVTLNWGIVTTFEIARFEIERSFDNAVYSRIATITDHVTLNDLQHFGANDNISHITSHTIYYRLKVIAENGRIKYSNVVVMRKDKEISSVVLYPNPASHHFTVKFSSDKEEKVIIRLIDKLGKVVLSENQNVRKGVNEILFENIGTLSTGVYTLQLSQENETTTHKLIIQHR